MAVPFAVIALVCVLFIREVPLRTTNDDAGLDLDVTAERELADR